MAKKNYAVIGFYGYRENQLDGQTIKTRCLKDTLEDIVEAPIYSLDTGDSRKKPIRILLKIVYAFLRYQRIYILPNINGLKYLLPVYHWLSAVTRTEVEYVVIGGWLYSFLQKNPNLLKHFYFLKTIHVETVKMVQDLSTIPNLTINHLPNFRHFKAGVFTGKRIKANSGLKCLFLARVRRDKGIEICIDAVNSLLDQGANISLDIYGGIEESYSDAFYSKIKGNKNILYKDCIDPFADDFYTVINQYDVLVLPTYYEGEGFPGTFLDAFIAGLPIVASDWKYNAQLVEHEKTGLIIKPKSSDSLVDALDRLIRNPDTFAELSQNAIQESYNYHAETLIRGIL